MSLNAQLTDARSEVDKFRKQLDEEKIRLNQKNNELQSLQYDRLSFILNLKKIQGEIRYCDDCEERRGRGSSQKPEHFASAVAQHEELPRGDDVDRHRQHS